MGFELRRVPPNWQHPKGEDGRYIPMFGVPFEDALAEWEKEAAAWAPEQHGGRSYETHAYKPIKGDGATPRRASHVPFTAAEATHFQVYEDTTEGTPISPVLPNRTYVVAWLVEQGYSAENATAFVEVGFVPSLTRVKGKMVEGIHGAEAFRKWRIQRTDPIL